MPQQIFASGPGFFSPPWFMQKRKRAIHEALTSGSTISTMTVKRTENQVSEKR